MSSDSSTKVNVLIMGKEYSIACPPDEETGLLQAAQYLDKQLRNIRENGKVIGLERIAIMVALNLSHELLQIQSHKDADQSGGDVYINRSHLKLDNALARFKQL